LINGKGRGSICFAHKSMVGNFFVGRRGGRAELLANFEWIVSIG